MQGAFAEPGVDKKPIDKKKVAAELAHELRVMAGWLGLDRVEVRQRGDLAASLRALIAA